MTQESSHSSSIVVNCDKNIEIYSDSIGKSIKRIVDYHANETLEDSLINSLSIGLYINNVSFIFHYGELTRGKGDMPSNQTIYEIASVTKTFTGTLASKAVLEGRINLDDDIRKHLSNHYPNLQYKGKPIKIRHLLTHTSGLPVHHKDFDSIPLELNEVEFAKRYYEIEKKQAKEDFLKYLARVDIQNVPGSHFLYSNFGTNLMAGILETVYQKPFQELISDEIISKAGMSETSFILTMEQKSRLANGYKKGKPMPKLPLSKTLWGAEGGLKSTLPDMMKYVRFQFQDLAMVKESHKKLYEIAEDYYIGYFWWIIENQNNDLHYRHDGGALRVKNVLLIYPESSFGISIFTNETANSVNQQLSKLSSAIYKDLFD